MTFTKVESVLASSDASVWASRPDADLAAVIVEAGARAVAVNGLGPGAATEAAGVIINAAAAAEDSAIAVLQLVAIPVIGMLLIGGLRPVRSLRKPNLALIGYVNETTNYPSLEGWTNSPRVVESPLSISKNVVIESSKMMLFDYAGMLFKARS